MEIESKIPLSILLLLTQHWKDVSEHFIISGKCKRLLIDKILNCPQIFLYEQTHFNHEIKLKVRILVEDAANWILLT